MPLPRSIIQQSPHSHSSITARPHYCSHYCSGPPPLLSCGKISPMAQQVQQQSTLLPTSLTTVDHHHLPRPRPTFYVLPIGRSLNSFRVPRPLDSLQGKSTLFTGYHSLHTTCRLHLELCRKYSPTSPNVGPATMAASDKFSESSPATLLSNRMFVLRPGTLQPCSIRNAELSSG